MTLIDYFIYFFRVYFKYFYCISLGFLFKTFVYYYYFFSYIDFESQVSYLEWKHHFIRKEKEGGFCCCRFLVGKLNNIRRWRIFINVWLACLRFSSRLVYFVNHHYDTIGLLCMCVPPSGLSVLKLQWQLYVFRQ